MNLKEKLIAKRDDLTKFVCTPHGEGYLQALNDVLEIIEYNGEFDSASFGPPPLTSQGVMIVRQQEVPRQILENIFVTALEGGSNYWYFLSDETVDLIRSVVPYDEDNCLSTAAFKAVMDYGISLHINDTEDKEQLLGSISISTMADRLTKLASDNGYKHHLEAELNEEGDAESSDVVFQYLVMGEVVYG